MVDINQSAATAAVVTNTIELASGIIRRLDGNSVSSSADGPRSVEDDVAVYLNRKLNEHRGTVTAIDVGVQDAAQ